MRAFHCGRLLPVVPLLRPSLVKRWTEGRKQKQLWVDSATPEGAAESAAGRTGILPALYCSPVEQSSNPSRASMEAKCALPPPCVFKYQERRCGAKVYSICLNGSKRKTDDSLSVCGFKTTVTLQHYPSTGVPSLLWKAASLPH